jgi:outer membrane lipoprotein-sorting protein
MRLILILFFMFCTAGCQAQMQKWQRERTVEHLSRLKNYHGHISWSIGVETSETEIWFQVPNRFLTISKNGEIVRSDGSTMEIYDPRTKFYSVFRNLPLVSESENQELIRDLFDQSMKRFTFTLGPLGKVAGRGVVELRATPKSGSIIKAGSSQILDEYSFPLKSVVAFSGDQTANYRFTKIAINEKFELPKAKIPLGAFKLEWDLSSASLIGKEKDTEIQGLKLEKSLKRETGETLSYYKKGAQFVSMIRYQNLGVVPPPRGISVKAGGLSGFLFPGPFSNTLTVSDGETTSLYSSNLLADDLLAFASR